MLLLLLYIYERQAKWAEHELPSQFEKSATAYTREGIFSTTVSLAPSFMTTVDDAGYKKRPLLCMYMHTGDLFARSNYIIGGEGGVRFT